MDWTVAAAPGIIRITRPGAKGAIQPLLIYLMVLDDPNLEDAFRAFFHRYSALAMRVARRYLDEHLAQDAVQNSFIAAARRFSVLMEWDEARRKRYFLVTVRNCAIDLLRREREYTGLEEGEPGSRPPRPPRGMTPWWRSFCPCPPPIGRCWSAAWSWSSRRTRWPRPWG